MIYGPIGSIRRESNSKPPIQLPRVESAGCWVSAKSHQRARLKSKHRMLVSEEGAPLISVIAVTINSS